MYPDDSKYTSEISNRKLLKLVDDYFHMLEKIETNTPDNFGETYAKATIALDMLLMNGRDASEQKYNLECMQLLTFLKENLDAKITSQNQTMAGKCREILDNLLSIVHN